ncbi:ATP-binding protein [Gilvimarinus polysaccharolyticus]|uniref:ATP-binding protein n=1 Tax=Gilvimarinus polysaccharolyticus TaxID=863921 RepID=UPI000673AB6F|nr:ATP-binding protein [Gilvimarinus polysaccharolyticus]
MRALIKTLTSPAALAILALTVLISYTALEQYRSSLRPDSPPVQGGQLNVSANQMLPITLEGYWRVYWDELLSPTELYPSDQFTLLPSRWNRPAQGELFRPGQGYATYTIDIEFSAPIKNLGLKVPSLYRAARIWANGEYLATIGVPGTDAGSETPRDEEKIVRLPDSDTRHLQLVIQVSNFHHVDGGMKYPLIIDDWDKLLSDEKWRVLRGIFLVSSTLTLAVYLLVMWSSAHAGREYLYLGLGLFWYSVRVFGTEKLIYYLYPGFSADWLLRFEYYGMYLCVPAYLLFLQALYPRDINYLALKLFWFTGITASVVTSAIDSRWFTVLRDPYQVVCEIYMVYCFYCLITIVARKRPWSGLVSFLGGVILLLFVNETLYYEGVINVHLTPWAYVFVALTSLIFLGQRMNIQLNSEAEQKALLQVAVESRTEELQQRLQELDVARQEALALAQKRSEFMAVLSHEIRTPLSGLLGAMRLIGQPGKETEDPKLKQYAIEAGESLLSVVNEALNASREKEETLFPTPINVHHFFNGIARISSAPAIDKGLTLECQFGAEVTENCWVLVDELKLRQITVNLLHNAIKFTRLGEVALTVEIIDSQKERVDAHLQDWESALPNPQELRLTIADTGIGICPEQISSIFDEYVQLDHKAGSAEDGVGLGLAIVRKLLRVLGGSIDVSSTPMIGTRFCCCVPVLRVNPKAPQDSPREVILDRNLHVLVVEDDLVNMTVVSELLRADGHKVSAVELPDQALQQMQEIDFDLCLFDIRLPQMSGVALLGQARQLVSSSSRGPVFVALTANTAQTDVDCYQEAGFSYVIEKPVSKKHLRFVLSCAAGLLKPNDGFLLQNDPLGVRRGDSLIDFSLWRGIVADLGVPRARGLLEAVSLSVGESVAQMRSAIEQRKVNDIEALAHKISGAAKSVGMITVAAMAGGIEVHPTQESHDIDALNTLVEQSLGQLAQALQRAILDHQG